MATSAVLSSVIAGCCAAVSVTLSVSVTASPTGGVPEAVAVLAMEPASRWSWVTVSVAVKIWLAPGARLTGATYC
ncbi:hypothetical protein E7811_17815 [Aliigemmobacter aestuarii]|uniref:Secreted protein n=1 Tax=Aliigemmobacter aestuarii TaxID=1445661 RepID=A0A4S3MJV2_9RHOB|nr:hypothetical protein [Gemmobacter aestuarii]THD80815.1 hypothetical protein E7811_17815 [Gemmobacter aestuarii]